MMEAIYFTVVGIGLYLLSDWILARLEQWKGQRFQYRSAIFFVIILILSLIVMQGIENLMKPDATQSGPEQGNEERSQMPEAKPADK